MKNAFQIFKTDVINIAKNPAAIIVIAAVACLPSLYAWLNIASSWDPYSNTRGVSVAVVSLDEGYEFQDEEVNIGDEVIVSLSKNDKLGWNFVTKDEAIKGVKHGDYYAAIIIPKDFSEKLLSVATDDIEKAKIDYYINEKINAISPKVTSSGASAIVENIQSNFVKETNKAVMSIFNTLGIELEKNYVNIERLRDTIYSLEEEMPEIYAKLQKANVTLGVLDQSVDKMHDSLDKVDEIDEKTQDLNKELIEKLNKSEDNVDEAIDSIIDNLRDTQDTFRKIPDSTNEISKKGDDIDSLIDSLHERQENLEETSDNLQDIYDRLVEQDEKLKDSVKIKEMLDSLTETEADLNELKSNLEEILFDYKTGNHPTVELIEKLQRQVNRMNDNINELIDQYESFLFPKLDIMIEELEDLSLNSARTIKQINDRNEKAIESVHRLQTEGDSLKAPEIKKEIDNISLNIDTNIDMIQSTIRSLTIVNRIKPDDQTSNLLKSLRLIKLSLEQAKSLMIEIDDHFANEQELNEELLQQLEKQLQLIKTQLKVATQLSANAKLPRKINDAIEELTNTKKQAQDRAERIYETQQNINDSIDELLQTAKNPKKSIKVIEKILKRVDNSLKLVNSIQDGLQDLQEFIDSDKITNEIERIKSIQERLHDINESIDNVIDRLQNVKERGGESLVKIDDKAEEVDQSIEDMIIFLNVDLRNKYKDITRNAEKSLNEVSRVLREVNKKIPEVRQKLEKANDAINKGQDKVDTINEHFPEVRRIIETLAEKIRTLEKKGDLDKLIDVLKNDPTRVSNFFADPISLDEHRLYPIPNYGSAMNPFYTTLALWVGGLILISSLKVDIDEKEQFKSYETYLGRLFSFVAIGIAQALIVTLGDLYIMKTFVVDKLAFVLFGVYISIVFMTIIYTLVSVFGNTGKVFAIVFMVMQLGGSGGTFPIQMAPDFFQNIHGFLPFTHAISIIRESIGGVIWEIAWRQMLYLGIHFIISLVFGIGLKKFFNKSSDKFMEKARKSKIVI